MKKLDSTSLLKYLIVQAFYEYINGADMLEFLKHFLNHEDPNVRAKACSAIGNMCRHSAYFYSSLVSSAWWAVS